jgi:hypothetical protein
MKKYLAVGSYGLHRAESDNNGNMQFGLVNGVSYLPDYSSEVNINFHKSVCAKLDDDGVQLTLSLSDAKMLCEVLSKLTNHLDQKVSLSKEKLLIDEAYFDDNDSEEETF